MPCSYLVVVEQVENIHNCAQVCATPLTFSRGAELIAAKIFGELIFGKILCRAIYYRERHLYRTVYSCGLIALVILHQVFLALRGNGPTG